MRARSSVANIAVCPSCDIADDPAFRARLARAIGMKRSEVNRIRRGHRRSGADDPEQRRLRIAADGTLDQPIERRQQVRLMRDRALAPAATPPNAITQIIPAGPQLGDAAINRAPRNPASGP
jgi:hypothetical protein